MNIKKQSFLQLFDFTFFCASTFSFPSCLFHHSWVVWSINFTFSHRLADLKTWIVWVSEWKKERERERERELTQCNFKSQTKWPIQIINETSHSLFISSQTLSLIYLLSNNFWRLKFSASIYHLSASKKIEIEREREGEKEKEKRAKGREDISSNLNSFKRSLNKTQHVSPHVSLCLLSLFFKYLHIIWNKIKRNLQRNIALITSAKM